MKSLAIAAALLGVVGCAEPEPVACTNRHYTVNASAKLTSNQREAFEGAMVSWSTALGEGFWRWDMTEAERDLDSCVISVYPDTARAIGDNRAGLSNQWTETGNAPRLALGTVQILSDIDDPIALRRIFLHEIGHLLGLQDTTDTTSVMFGFLNGPMILDIPEKDAEAVKKLWHLSNEEIEIVRSSQ